MLFFPYLFSTASRVKTSLPLLKNTNFSKKKRSSSFSKTLYFFQCFILHPFISWWSVEQCKSLWLCPLQPCLFVYIIIFDVFYCWVFMLFHCFCETKHCSVSCFHLIVMWFIAQTVHHFGSSFGLCSTMFNMSSDDSTY